MKKLAVIAFTLSAGVSFSVADEDPPMNCVQFIGTHNSYHIAPSPKVRAMIETFSKGTGDALDHTHRPLREQLEILKVRQIELDLYADPKGWLFSNPLGATLAGEAESAPDPAWKKPGMKILHSPDFDFLTTVPTLRQALREMATWSKANPEHEPVLVMLELKEESFSPRIQPIPFDESQLKALEDEIRGELPAEMILTPNLVRGDSATLRDAVTGRGWPKLSQAAGKFLFALDNEGPLRDRYLALSPNKDLRDRLIFVDVPPTHPAAAWMKRNNPTGGFKDIRKLVAAGFMVRTRADSDLKEVRAKDLTRFKKAVASGAQWISTDAPEELPNLPGYRVHWDNDRTWQMNPVNGVSK